MIAFRDSLPLVRSEHGNAVALEGSWLWVAIHEAALRAGYRNWWPVDDLVTGISAFLRNGYVRNVIDLPELEHIVRLALRDVGYEDVAAQFRALPLTQGISLIQCLRNQPSFGHATFFEKLSEAIDRLRDEKIRHFHFYDLQACADRLTAAVDRSRSSKYLREKIVAFVRERVQTQEWRQQVWCSIR